MPGMIKKEKNGMMGMKRGGAVKKGKKKAKKKTMKKGTKKAMGGMMNNKRVMNRGGGMMKNKDMM